MTTWEQLAPDLPFPQLATSLQLLPVASLEDLYAMRLPIYLPSIDFIARFWPEARLRPGKPAEG